MEFWLQALILLGVGVISGFLNIMAGGGSSLTLPAMIFLGMESTMANGTNRIGVLIQNVAAIISFKQDKIGNFPLGFKMSLFAVPGALIGTLVAVRINDETFNIVLGIIMLGIVIWMLIPKKKVEISDLFENNPPWLLYPIIFLIGLYIGFIQVGVGFIIMAALYYFMKISLVKVNVHKVIIVMIAIIPSIIIFELTGNIDWKLGAILGAGNAVGGWFAAKLQVRKGDKVIKYVLSVAIVLVSLKLFGVY